MALPPAAVAAVCHQSPHLLLRRGGGGLLPPPSPPATLPFAMRGVASAPARLPPARFSLSPIPKSFSTSSALPWIECEEQGFVQLFLMAGVFMMSLRSLGQKHRLNDLAVDNADLRREREDLSHHMRDLQDALRREADADSSGALASHLRRIFTAHPAPATTAEDQ